jgi:hypothetical protein
MDISNYRKAAVLAALYNASRPMGLGFLEATPEPMTEAEAQTFLDDSRFKYFDYLKGRVLKVDLSGNTVDLRLYDRDNGEGAGERAIRAACEAAK